MNDVDIIWHEDSRNRAPEHILSDYCNGFRLYLKSHRQGYKFYVAIRRHKKYGINDDLLRESPVAYFENCDLEEAKRLGIKHFEKMIV
jgi:hypothetical protein